MDSRSEPEGKAAAQAGKARRAAQTATASRWPATGTGASTSSAITSRVDQRALPLIVSSTRIVETKSSPEEASNFHRLDYFLAANFPLKTASNKGKHAL
jgi:hypothetical protein